MGSDKTPVGEESHHVTQITKRTVIAKVWKRNRNGRKEGMPQRLVREEGGAGARAWKGWNLTQGRGEPLKRLTREWNHLTPVSEGH